jgi:hypothetical protein
MIDAMVDPNGRHRMARAARARDRTGYAAEMNSPVAAAVAVALLIAALAAARGFAAALL